MSVPNFSIVTEGPNRLPLDEFRKRVQIQRGLERMQYAIGTMARAIDELAAVGLMVRTGSGAATTRSIQGSTEGIKVTNGDGSLGNPTISPANDLGGLEGLTGINIIPRRIAVDTWVGVPVTDFGLSLLSLNNAYELYLLIKPYLPCGSCNVYTDVVVQDVITQKYHRVFCVTQDEEGNAIEPHLIVEDQTITPTVEASLVVQDMHSQEYHRVLCVTQDGDGNTIEPHLIVEEQTTTASEVLNGRVKNANANQWHRVYCTTLDEEGNTIPIHLIIEDEPTE